MKPSKKQINPKNQSEKENLAPGIQTFFKPASKTLVDKNIAQVKPKPNDGPKTFYVDVLKEKLRILHKKDDRDVVDTTYEAAGPSVVVEKEEYTQARATNSIVESGARDSQSFPECTGCVQNVIERDEWEEKYKQEVEKRKQLKKVYLNLTVRFAEVDSKYNALLNTTKSVHRTSDDPVTSTDDIFTPNEVKFLQCMALDKKNDCSFILHCLKFAYKPDLSVLVFKTLKGTQERTEFTIEGEQIRYDGKAPVTPKKVELIKGLFIERISKCEIGSADYVERIKDSYVNKYIAAGIRNLSKKFK